MFSFSIFGWDKIICGDKPGHSPSHASHLEVPDGLVYRMTHSYFAGGRGSKDG